MSVEGLKRAVDSGMGSWWSGPAVLYLDDVEDICDIFARVNPEVTLRLDGYELGTLADASRLKSLETTDLQIKISDPYSIFEVSGHQFWVYIGDKSDLTSVGLMNATKGIVEKRRLWSITSVWGNLLTLLPVLVVLGLVFVLPRDSRPDAVLWLVVAFPLLSSAAQLVALRNIRRGGRVILRHSGAQPNFWKANRDVLMVLLGSLGTIAATVIGYLILDSLGVLGAP